MDQWRNDLTRLSSLYPCVLGALIRPKIIFLPRWWPVEIGAWVYLNWVIVSAGLIDAPVAVRRYILGHEYGHIRQGHTGLQIAHSVAVAGAVLAGLFSAWMISMAVLLGLVGITLAAVLPSAVRRRELEADALAASAYGREIVLDGALWMAHKTGTIANRDRRHRLEALGWVRMPRQVIYNVR